MKKLIVIVFIIVVVLMTFISLGTKEVDTSDYRDLDKKLDQNIEDEMWDIVNLKTMNDEVIVKEDNNSIHVSQNTLRLKGKIICIDAGHQSKGNNSQEPIAPGSNETKAKVSSGTRGVSTKKYEYELNLEVALKLKNSLESEGAIVHMVRETHDVDISNVERALLANEVNADISFRIHADSSIDSQINGYSILIPGTKYVKEDIVLESKEIAKYIDKNLPDHIPNKSRGIVTRNDLTGFNWCEVPMVLVEMGFMSNPEEDNRMSTDEFQDNFISGIIESLVQYFDKE